MIRFSACTSSPIVTFGSTTQFFNTAPFLILHPRPIMLFSISPSIVHPFEMIEERALAVSKYFVGQESLVLV